MSRAWMAQLLLMPLFVISQETCSSVTCSNNPGDPGNARLGNDTTALLHFQVASTTTTTLPACVAEINTGDCNAMSACKCEPDINPQPIGDFPDTQGTLQCGGKLSCNSQSASNTNFFRMNTPSPLECSGQNSCQIDFNVENIGSMCVTGDNAVGPSSQAGTYKLADPDVATGRVNDVCCAREVGQNQPTCKSPTFENVGSFFCTGDVSCDNVQATLSGDFYCRSLQGCGDQTNPPNDDEYWQWTTSGKHCIRCQSTDPGLDQGLGRVPLMYVMCFRVCAGLHLRERLAHFANYLEELRMRGLQVDDNDDSGD